MEGVRHWKWRVIMSLVIVCALSIVGLSMASPSSRSRATVATVVSYEPAICTQDLQHSECGDARITVRTVAGRTQVLKYDGNRHPESPPVANLVEFYKPGTKLQITTSGSNGEVVRVKHVGD
jgi:hypothetical protein